MTSIKANFVMAAAGLALATLASTVGLARSADSGASQRPPNVPANYVLTPYGYVAPQDIVQLRKGETVAMRQARRRASGNPGECSSPRFSTTGVKLDPTLRPGKLAIKANYVAEASVDLPKDYQEIQTTTDIIVPPAPTRRYNQVLHLITGLHDTQDLYGPMVQTVVGWRTNSQASEWTASTWFLSPYDECHYISELVDLKPGQKVRQVIEARRNNGQPEIQASILDLEANTTLLQTTFKPQSFDPDQVVNIGMEAYRASKCDLMPAGGEIIYPHISTFATTPAGKTDISNLITVLPALDHACDVVLTLSDE